MKSYHSTYDGERLETAFDERFRSFAFSSIFEKSRLLYRGIIIVTPDRPHFLFSQFVFNLDSWKKRAWEDVLSENGHRMQKAMFL